jgi:hypothetical protein
MIRKLLLFIFLAAPFFVGCRIRSTAQDIQVAGVQAPVISLNGNWKFNLDPQEEFWKTSVVFQDWEDILVPGECQMQGLAIKHDRPFVYKRAIRIPEDYRDKEVRLVFYGVYSYARLWVNGQFVREHSGGFTRWECDISDHVTPGEMAVLTLEVTDRADDISYGSGYAKHQIGGILRDVELMALPEQNFSELYFETHLDDEYKDAELKIFYELKNESPSKVKVELFGPDGSLTGSVEGIVAGTAAGTEEGGSKSGQLALPVRGPLLWDAEHPHLYRVLVSLFQDGKELMKTSEKIGFREVRVEENNLLVNGRPVKLRGACRHDIHPTLGRMTTAHYDLKDVLLAKECNMNFIRTSHYPPSEAFLDYCDRYGIYVEDETAVCFVGSHRTEAYRASGASQSDPAYTGRYLSQLEEMVRHHRNHPSVIIWSIGNENTFGSNFVESYRWIKEEDPTRPVIYSYPGQVPDSLRIFEIISMHYPSWKGDLEQYGIRTEGFESDALPMLFDEWAHVACYNNFELKEDPNVRSFWGQSLDSMWTYLFEAEGGLGGAIWCMLDETFMLPEDLEGFNDWWGILDRNVIPATFNRPVVGYGEWGILDIWRRRKPEFWATKKAYSPTKIYARTLTDFQSGEALEVPVHNRFDHTDFSELKIRWRHGGRSGELDPVKLEPHRKGQLVFPAGNWDLDDQLHIQFYVDDTLLVDEYRLRLGEKTVQLPELSRGKLDVYETDRNVHISGKVYSLDLNKETGLLQNLTVNDVLIIQSGPWVNLKFPGNSVQYSTIQMEDYALNWQLEEMDYEIQDGIARVHVSGSYDRVSASFQLQFDANGVFIMDYRIDGVPAGKYIQEAGIRFITGDHFEQLTWDRASYFSAYPPDDPGRPEGMVDLGKIPAMNYRQEPGHDWEMDAYGFYYFGLEKKLPYTNVVRSLKEHIYSFTLESTNSKLEVSSYGTQACRFDKINGVNTLIINELWDYNSLLWGNYQKKILSRGDTLEGKVFFEVSF